MLQQELWELGRLLCARSGWLQMGSGDEYLKMTDPTALEEKVRATDPQLTSSGASLVRG